MPIKDPIKRREYEKKYCQTHKKEKALYAREYRKREYVKKYYLKLKRKYLKRRDVRMRIKQYRQKIKEKLKTINALNRAIIKGDIIRGHCDICGEKHAEGHHNDYSKPFNVVWLCKKHHAEVHRRALK